MAFGLAVPVKLVLDAFQDVRKRHFGNARLADNDLLWILGTALQSVGKTLRTGDLTPTTKGRVNTELLDLLRTIQKHEKARLSYRELMDALRYAEVHISKEEDLRLFVHRARKKGWLN